MRTSFILVGNRKALVTALSEITGERAEYMRMPTCAYKIGDLTVEKDGTVVGDISGILGELNARGFEEVPEEVNVEVSIPMVSGRTLRNLINLIYVRSDLINKALGTEFFVPEDIKDGIKGMEDVSEIVRFVENNCIQKEITGERALSGVSFDEEKITFVAPHPNASDEQIRTFTGLVSMMAGYAREMFRVNAVKPSMENEKYEMRTWLLRLGMIGPEYKEARRVLLENLTGHPAYRTKESEEAARSRRRKTVG